jgi:prepilin-type N-terminal cleavage/methylation domain-containing protein
LSRSLKAGFTLTEWMVASMLLLTISMILYRSVRQCFELSVSTRNYLAAEAMAFDRLWLEFNRPLHELEAITEPMLCMSPIPPNTVLQQGGLIRCAVMPVGDEAWDIRVNLVWPTGGMIRALPTDLHVRRYRTERGFHDPRDVR